MSSIDVVLSSLVGLIENRLQAAHALNDAWIVLGPVADKERTDGSPTDCIFAAVVSVVGDNAVGRFDAGRPDASGRSVDRSPPFFIDVNVAFVADFQRQNYGTGLRVLSDIIAFLQERPVIEAEDSPAVAEQTGRLPVEMVSLDFGQNSHVASMLGLKGQPFVVVKLRRLPFKGTSFRTVSAPVKGLGGAGPAPRR